MFSCVQVLHKRIWAPNQDVLCLKMMNVLGLKKYSKTDKINVITKRKGEGGMVEEGK